MTPGSRISVTANQLGLAAGMYSGSVTLTAPSASSMPDYRRDAHRTFPGVDHGESPVIDVHSSAGEYCTELASGAVAERWHVANIFDRDNNRRVAGGGSYRRTDPFRCQCWDIEHHWADPGVYLSKFVVKSSGNPDIDVPVSLTVTAPVGDVFGIDSPPLLYNLTSNAPTQSPQSRIFFVQSHSTSSVSFTTQVVNGTKGVSVSTPSNELRSGN